MLADLAVASSTIVPARPRDTRFDAALAFTGALITQQRLDEALADIAAELQVDGATLALGAAAPHSAIAPTDIATMLPQGVAQRSGVEQRQRHTSLDLDRGFIVGPDVVAVETAEPPGLATARGKPLRQRPAWAASAVLSSMPEPLVLQLWLRHGLGPFDAEQLGRCNRVLPLLRRGAALATEAWHAALLAHLRWLDQQHLGAIVLDRGGRIRETNRTAGTELGLRMVDGRVRAHYAGESAALDAAMAAAQADRATPPTVHRALVHTADDARPVIVTCASLRTVQPGLPGTAAIILTLRPAAMALESDADPTGSTALRLAALRSLFALTPREAMLCLLLADAKPIAETARIAGISTEHARQRAKRIYAKTGTHSQAALAALIARL